MGLRARHTERSDPPAADRAGAEFETFFRDHYAAVARLAYGVLGESAGSQDVAQEVFVAAYRRFPGDYERAAAGWVRVAAVHTALNVLRGERRRGRPRPVGDVVRALPSAEETVLARESRAEVRQVLRRLPRRTAAILVMRHGGMSYLEIADALGIAVGSVGTVLRRAESALRKEMADATH